MKTLNTATRQIMHYGNTQWSGTVSKPSRFTNANVAFHRKLNTAASDSAFSATATESCYVWNIADNNSNIQNTYRG